jgi:hypothetical protein
MFVSPANVQGEDHSTKNLVNLAIARKSEDGVEELVAIAAARGALRAVFFLMATKLVL